MKKNIVFIIVLIIIILFSGCVGQDGGNGGPKYSDNALALLDYKTKTNLYHNEETSIDFWLTNQVEYDVRNVDVKLSNPNIFTITRIICDTEEKAGDTCHFDKISTLESKRIQIFLKAPSKEQIGNLGDSFKVDLSVQYDYDGESICYFRILRLDKESTTTKIQLTQTTGPVHVKIEPGFIIQEQTDQGAKTISDWVIEGKSFNTKVSTENVGSLGSNYEFPEINLTDFKMLLEHVKANDQSLCDFTITDNYLTGNKVMVPTKKPLTCLLTSDTGFTEPEIPGVIRAEYSYRYKFIKTETFKIEKIE